MRAGRDLVEQLVVVEQRDRRHRRADPGQRPVVAAAAAAEPVPVPADRERGNDHEVGAARSRRRPRRGSVGCEQPARAGRERVGTLVRRPVQVEVVAAAPAAGRSCRASTARTPGRWSPARCRPRGRPRSCLPSRPPAGPAAVSRNARPAAFRSASLSLALAASSSLRSKVLRSVSRRPGILRSSGVATTLRRGVIASAPAPMPCTRSSIRLVRVLSMAHSGTVTKAVIPVAGLGTRFLPATKVTPKVMMPVVDKPAIQYVVEEAVGAGLARRAADHRRRPAVHRGALQPRQGPGGRRSRRAATRRRSPRSGPRPSWPRVSYVRQDAPRGLGHAVLCAADHVGDEPFAVLLGDDLIGARRRPAGQDDRGQAAATAAASSR